ncbi:hypothetical protein TNCV_317771 [Trichonephila clavipes]|nr:hypothetical protein TNCV_317771 [Trichonephila clavipes]
MVAKKSCDTPLVPPPSGNTSSPTKPSEQRNSHVMPDMGRRNLTRFQFPLIDAAKKSDGKSPVPEIQF